MLFAIGTRVKFLHSKDEGVVTAILDNGMVNVLLEDEGLEIPAFEEDLMRAEDYIDKSPSVKAKIIPGKQDKSYVPPERPEIESQYAILRSHGIQIGFEPIEAKSGLTEKYNLYLINDTRHDVVYNFTLRVKGQNPINYNGKLIRLSTFYVCDMPFDQLNDSPILEMECWRLTTEGLKDHQQKQLRIKPKQFFKAFKTAPLLNKQVYLFKLFERLLPKDEKKKEDLKTYTQRNVRPGFQGPKGIENFEVHDINEFATFNAELDLHIEKLVPDSSKMSTGDILRIQMNTFERYLERAIRLGIPKVFIIHGVGKGRLKDSIATRLLQTPEIKSFKNEYHPRYGYGATEIDF